MVALTNLLILLVSLSLTIVGTVIVSTIMIDANKKRTRRRQQRDRNTKHIELNELRLDQIEQRIGLLETQIQNIK